MSLKSQSIGALFLALIIILAVNPKYVNKVYNSILGRVFLICVVIFFAMNNTTLGLLIALTIIAALNQFDSLVEGMENGTPTTIGEENIESTGPQTVLTKEAAQSAQKKISDIKQDIANGTIGVDKEDIKTAIMSKDSNQIPVDPNMNSSTEVSAASTAMLNPNNSTLENFSNYAPAY
jgi:anti-sigma28 factor (negative regulator of flagellin synthesis)